MRLVVLGSCGGYPEPNRACSGYLMEAAGRRLWLDAGSGTLARLLGRCSLAELDGAWLTHLHPDHWTDLPLAIHALAVGAAERQRPLPIYGPRGWADAVGADLRWRDEGDTAVHEARELSDGLLTELDGVAVRSAAVEHGIEAYGLRIDAQGFAFAYSGDSAPCDALVELAREVDLFLCAAGTMTSSPIHANPSQAGELASAASASRLLLTHLRPGSDRKKVLQMARATYSGKVALAIEGAEFEIPSASI